MTIKKRSMNPSMKFWNCDGPGRRKISGSLAPLPQVRAVFSQRNDPAEAASSRKTTSKATSPPPEPFEVRRGARPSGISPQVSVNDFELHYISGCGVNVAVDPRSFSQTKMAAAASFGPQQRPFFHEAGLRPLLFQYGIDRL
ncbi:hypothetical protein KMZ93_05780 [Bradyrhizobium sediminis]|uniref:Uncharacterized protein n=1 Tax=Bradyrhizobium sediminis TaxID=2840469 RepID=A0A975P0Z9_9BRAD|nr:hypothetical protein [Bradyrhizobium sediminis]QWG24416.1 hypothetical protein KMZ93_05780 [Bradyrhizobium sediminis]